MDNVQRAAWLAERRGGIGGSDAAAVLGFHPYRNALDVWLDKRGERPEEPAGEPAYWGTVLERVVAERYAHDHDVMLVNPERIFRHPNYPHIFATPDRLVLGNGPGAPPTRVLECKTASAWMADRWGAPGTDIIPAHYVPQCVLEMAVTGCEWCDVPVLIGGQDYREFTLRRDPVVERVLVERLDAWWQRHIIGGERPDITWGGGTERWLNERFEREREQRPRPGTPHVDGLVREYREATEALEVWEQTRETARLKLCDLIGEAVGFEGTDPYGRGYRVTWKKPKDATTVDYEAIATKVAAVLVASGVEVKTGSLNEDGSVTAGEPMTGQQYLDALVKEFTTTKPRDRRFTLRPTSAGD